MNVIKDEYYRCERYTNKRTDVCRPHTIQREAIYNAVIADIREYAQLAYSDERQLIERLTKSNAQHAGSMNKRHEKIIAEKEKRLGEIDMLAQSLFEEKLSGNVPSRFLSEWRKNTMTNRLRLQAKSKHLKMN